MTRVRGARPALLALLALSLLGFTPAASPAFDRPFDADLVGEFTFGACPAGAPAAGLCLHDRLSGPLSDLGSSTGEFDVVIDVAASGADNCAPATKTGSFVAANGDRLRVNAAGRYCFATSTTNYAFSIVGGTGGLAGTSGAGTWAVPPPSTLNAMGGAGEEHLRGTISYPGPSPNLVRGGLRLGWITFAGHRRGHHRLRVRVFADGSALSGVVLTIHRGSAGGHIVGRSRIFSVHGTRRLSLRLRAPLNVRTRYVAVATGHDAAGNAVRALRLLHRRHPRDA
jgi:hypothetical protein